MVYPDYHDGIPRYGWTFFANAPSEIDPHRLADTLDANLKRAHADYESFRETALGPPTVSVFHKDFLRRYVSENQHRGQFKMRHIFRRVDEYAGFAERYLPKGTSHAH
jgi:hypothetical protein